MNLMIRSTSGRYRQASKAEVLQQAAQYLAQELSKPVGAYFGGPSEGKVFLSTALAARDSEVFCALFLDTRLRLISFEEVFYGTIDAAPVYPRVVVKRALELNAAAVMFAHNHPAGVSAQSEADEFITSRLKAALALVEVRVLDHFVVARDGIVSFAERGLI